MSDSVTVERSESGEWWRMSYRGETDLVDEEPTEQRKLLFVQSVNAAIQRRAAEAKARARAADHGDRMVESVDGRNWQGMAS